MHPGIRAMHIAGSAAETVRPQFERACAELVQRAFREIGLNVD